MNAQEISKSRADTQMKAIVYTEYGSPDVLECAHAKTYF
jgi:hypothetical protein